MKKIFLMIVGLSLPGLLWAQDGVAEKIGGLQGVLDNLYTHLLPQCAALIGVGRGIAGFAAIWYIAVRVWRHIARAEPVDFYPLLRPFVLGFAILIFPAVIALINGVMQPAVTGTNDLVHNTDAAITALLQQKQDALQKSDQYLWYVGANGEGDEALWEQYSGQASQGAFSGISNAFKFALAKARYNLHTEIKSWISGVLQVVYEAAALTINTLRTFNLLVLAIVGPLVFGLSVFDGLHHTLTHWLARYLNVFLWLPVANIFGAIIGNIQVQMLQMDLSQIQARGDTYFSATDGGYLVFMVIGIIGYFTVPSVAGHIIQVGGHGALLSKATSIFSSAVNRTAAAAGGAGGWIAGHARNGLSNIWHSVGDVMGGYREKDQQQQKNDYQRKKLSGSDPGSDK